MRTSLLLCANGTPPKVLAITSSLPSEGKTLTAVNCATVLAQQGASVLLVDADLRQPSLHEAFGIPQDPGLSGILTGACTERDATVEAEAIPNLAMLPSGAPPAYPAEMLASAKMLDLIDRWRSEYDHVVHRHAAGLDVYRRGGAGLSCRRRIGRGSRLRHDQTECCVTPETCCSARMSTSPEWCSTVSICSIKTATTAHTESPESDNPATVPRHRPNQLITVMKWILIFTLAACSAVATLRAQVSESTAVRQAPVAECCARGRNGLPTVLISRNKQTRSKLPAAGRCCWMWATCWKSGSSTRPSYRENSGWTVTATSLCRWVERSQVKGLTPEQVQTAIEQRFRQREILRDPHVEVFVLEYATQRVTVMGEVKMPGSLSHWRKTRCARLHLDCRRADARRLEDCSADAQELVRRRPSPWT